MKNRPFFKPITIEKIVIFMIRLVISCAARHRSVTYQLVSQIVFGFFMFSLSLGQTIATYRNIVGRNMLRAFGHLVATCWVLLSQF